MTDWVTRETRQTGATGQLSSHNKDQGMRLFCPARPSLQVTIRESETRLFACARVSHRVCVCVCVRPRYFTRYYSTLYRYTSSPLPQLTT